MSLLKKIAVLILLNGLATLLASPARAVPRQIEASVAQGKSGRLIDIEVFPGFGMTISFLPVGEKIINVWVDDMNRFAPPSFNRPLCPGSGVAGGSNNSPSNITPSVNGQVPQASNSCQPADVIHLRRSNVRPFPGMSSSSTGRTLLTAITEKAGSQRIYQFNLIPKAGGNPRWTSLSIIPDSSSGSMSDVVMPMPIPRGPRFNLPSSRSR
jgi:hypothetical protein